MQIVLLVGAKLQVMITKMGQRIEQRGEVVKVVPLVQPGDDLFWFNKPRLTLYLINFVLFQVLHVSFLRVLIGTECFSACLLFMDCGKSSKISFGIATTQLQFGIKSSFHSQTEDAVIKVSMVVVMFLWLSLSHDRVDDQKHISNHDRTIRRLRAMHHGPPNHNLF
ncbi:hypothetical protein JHK82_037962 [Glycine max]|nr:hypothetical protein JHK82_037962 [Glycine max]